MTLSQREKQLLAGVAVLAVILSFINWVHVPLFARRAQASETADQAAAELLLEKAKLAKEGDLNGREAAVGARERTIDAWVPGKSSAVLFIWYLSQAEMRSGARVKGVTLSGRSEVQVKSAPDAAPGNGTTGGNQAGAAPDATKPADAGSTAEPSAADLANATVPAASSPTPAPAAKENSPTSVISTLTVVRLDLKVEAPFVEHLLFNQMLEEMPLFLNTRTLSLSPVASSKSPLDQVGKLVMQGNTWMAGQLLGASPKLTGTYQIDLYFKGAKVGPPTEPMKFAEPTGRTDPFVMDGVDEFLQALMDYFANPGTWNPDQTWPAYPAPVDPSDRQKEMG